MKRVVAVFAVPLVACSLISLDDLGSGNASDASDAKQQEGGCGDTTSSASNCGACGHDCLGGDCVASLCQAVPVAAIQSQPRALAVEGPTLFWIASSEIHRAPTSLDAGTWTRVGKTGVAGLFDLTPASPTIHAIATPSPIYAVTVAEDEPATGNPPASVGYVNTLGNVSSFAFDGGHQYLYTSSGACKGNTGWCILAFDDPQVASKRFADDLAPSGVLTVDGSRVFYASDKTVGTFVYTDAQGTGTALATTSKTATSIAADGAGVYVTNPTLGSILVIPRAGVLDGGAPAPIASGQKMPVALAAGAGLVAWGAQDGLWACDPKACKAQNVWKDATVSSIAIDGAAIYWTDSSRAGVYKIAR